MKIRYLSRHPVIFFTGLLLAGCNINKSINVPAGAHWSSGSSTINGEITVGDHAVVNGGLRTINGTISIGTGSHVGDLTTINGAISLSDGAQAGEIRGVNADVTLGKQVVVNGTVETVNGYIKTASGSRIQGDVRSVNGGITLCNSQVIGNVVFYNGTVHLAQNSVVQGDITAKKPNTNNNEGNRPPSLIVGPGSTVGGTITFERPGELYVSDSATIHAVVGATQIKFTGAAPANITTAKCPGN